MTTSKYGDIKVRDKTAISLAELQKKRDECIYQIHKLQKEVFALNEQINDLVEKAAARKLQVSDHAIQRFQERILHMPARNIRSILSSPELNTAYLQNGPGKYTVKEVPDAIVIIHNFTVITVLNKNDYAYRLQLLPQYLDFCIEQRARRALGEPFQLIPFKSYLNNYHNRKYIK